MKMSIKSQKPRNPLVAPAHFRRAGAHRSRGSADRQTAGRLLRRELELHSRTKHTP